MRTLAQSGKLNEPMGDAVYRFLRDEVLTEENTDLALEWLEGKIPKVKIFGFIPLPTHMVIGVIDKLIPEKLLEMILHLMEAKGLTSERRMESNSPFNSDG